MTDAASGERLLAADDLAGFAALGAGRDGRPRGPLRRYAPMARSARPGTPAGCGRRATRTVITLKGLLRQDDGGADAPARGARGPGGPRRRRRPAGRRRRPATPSSPSPATRRWGSWCGSARSAGSASTASDGAVVELSVDDVEVVVADRVIERFAELEVELRAGDESALDPLVDLLSEVEELVPADTSKLERALEAVRREVHGRAPAAAGLGPLDVDEPTATRPVRRPRRWRRARPMRPTPWRGRRADAADAAEAVNAVVRPRARGTPGHRPQVAGRPGRRPPRRGRAQGPPVPPRADGHPRGGRRAPGPTPRSCTACASPRGASGRRGACSATRSTPSAPSRHRRRLRLVAADLGAVRDLDVLIEAGEAYQAPPLRRRGDGVRAVARAAGGSSATPPGSSCSRSSTRERHRKWVDAYLAFVRRRGRRRRGRSGPRSRTASGTPCRPGSGRPTRASAPTSR